MSDQLKQLEKAVKALQDELKEQKEATLYALSLIVLLAKELGLPKSRLAELSREAMKHLPRDMENLEFRKMMKDIAASE
ncbi:MAG TPA: hypothetical protein VJC08_00445 [bacterium]|nr:MAG: hypothetical protein A2036_03770 [Omnitrophica bacterium GWA2_50_21]HLD49644.1 hypothetical protein [bacterium]